jgi:hypothetical protein
VPYIGVGAGVAYVDRKGYYDYNAVQYNEQYTTCLVAQASIGVEFFFSARAGIRLEAGGHYFGLPANIYDTGGTPANFPILYYASNPFSVRYASGVFFLF